MKLYVQKHPDEYNLAHCMQINENDILPDGWDAGWEEMTKDDFKIWKNEQLLSGWTPLQREEKIVQKQSVHKVLKRLSKSEYRKLKTCDNADIQIAIDMALSEGVISSEDEDFIPFVQGCHALGIIDESRWVDLLKD